MKTLLISFISSLITLVVIDAIWLNTMISRFYSPKLSHLTAENVNYFPAILFYVIYAIGLTFLIIIPALQGNYSLTKVFLLGALFGLCAYGAYDFTNQATLKNWPTIITIVDLIWGTFLTGASVSIAFYLVKFF